MAVIVGKLVGTGAACTIEKEKWRLNSNEPNAPAWVNKLQGPTRVDQGKGVLSEKAPQIFFSYGFI